LYDPDMALRVDLDVPVFLKSAIQVVENILNSNMTEDYNMTNDYINEDYIDHEEAMENLSNPNPLYWKYGQMDHCSGYHNKELELCPDFSDCILGSIPNLVLLSTDDSKSGKKNGDNARKITQIVGCADGFVQARRDLEEVTISCKCNAETGCFWEPSVNQFHCIPRGQCANVRNLAWTEITEDSVRYREKTDPLYPTIAIPISAQPSSKIIIVKFPVKINADLVMFNVWNGSIRETYCDKGLTLLEMEVDEANVLLEISYDKNRYKAKDFNDLKYASFNEYDRHLGECAFSLMNY